MLIGLYGGTFDPVHIGHQHVAQTVVASLGLESLHWVLSARPGHRLDPMTSVDHRWAMLLLACAESPRFVADRTEIDRAGKSFTYLTVKAWREADPTHVPCWIMGLDAYVTLPQWFQWRDLMQECNIVVVERPGESVKLPTVLTDLETEHRVEKLEDQVGQILHLDVPMKEVSATDIRRKIAQGKSVEHLLMPSVYHYIRQHQLYTENAI